MRRHLAAAVVLSALVFAALVAAAAARSTAAPRNTGQPSISGTTTVGRTLSTNRGIWTNGPTRYRYQWARCDNPGKTNCRAVAGATSASYRLAESDAGHTFFAAVTACNADGCATAETDAVGPVRPRAAPQNREAPSIRGNPDAGSLQTAVEGRWTNAPTAFSFQWLRCDQAGNGCQAILGATGRTYATNAGDLGLRLRVRVTARNERGSRSATSAPTAPIGTDTGGAGVTVATIVPPNRLDVPAVEFTPRVLTSRAPFTVRFRVTDARGVPVAGALVYAVGLPYAWVRGAPEATTDRDGWATATFSPTRALPRRSAIVFFVRARKPGDPLLGGVSTRRLVQVTVRVSG